MPLKEGGLPEECLPVREFPKVKWLVMFRPGRDVVSLEFRVLMVTLLCLCADVLGFCATRSSTGSSYTDPQT